MSLAYGTATTTPNGNTAIQDFQVHDSIQAGSPSGTSGLNWTPSSVGFSEGTSGGYPTTMVCITFTENKIICTPNHPFLLSNGKIKQAGRLVPGADMLANAEGNPVRILEISLGEYSSGVHSITTANAYNDCLDEHLLLTAGVVTGDYYVETHYEELLKKGLAEEDAGQISG